VTLEEAGWIAAVTSVAVSIASAVVALLARHDAKRSAQAAEEITAIEQQRRHEELTPQLHLEAECRALGSDRVRVIVKLDGPAGLDRLDRVNVRVRDERDRSPATIGGPTQQQITTTIWGPYRFVPGVDGADHLGRALPAVPLVRG
jgi:hypothetical protein